MSNQNPKSDEMLKSYVAQIASQGVAIFLQQKQEAKEQEVGHFEVYDKLQTRLEDMEANYRSLEEVKNNLQTELKERLYELQAVKEDYKSVREERDEVKRWWHRQLTENRELKEELRALQSGASLVDIARGVAEALDENSQAEKTEGEIA